MKISTYISTNYMTSFERAVIGCPNLLEAIMHYTKDIIKKHTGKILSALVCPPEYPKNVLPGVKRLPTEGGHRHMDLKTIAENSTSDTDWIIIARPLIGWIDASRLQQFLAEIAKTKHDSVISTIPLSSLGHLFWNFRFIPNEYEHDTFAVPCPSRTQEQKVTRQSFDGAQDVWRKDYCRSQDLPTMHTNDSALIAIRTGNLQKNNPLDAAQPIVHTKTMDEDAPWFYKLPIHELHEQKTINLNEIEWSLANPIK